MDLDLTQSDVATIISRFPNPMREQVANAFATELNDMFGIDREKFLGWCGVEV